MHWLKDYIRTNAAHAGIPRTEQQVHDDARLLGFSLPRTWVQAVAILGDGGSVVGEADSVSVSDATSLYARLNYIEEHPRFIIFDGLENGDHLALDRTCVEDSPIYWVSHESAKLFGEVFDSVEAMLRYVYGGGEIEQRIQELGLD